MNDCLSAYQLFNALKENLFDIRSNIGKSSLLKSVNYLFNYCLR